MSTVIEEQLTRRALNSRTSTPSLQAPPSSHQRHHQKLELAFALSVAGAARPLAHYATLSDPVTFFGHALRAQVQQQFELRAAALTQQRTAAHLPAVAHQNLNQLQLQQPVAVNGGNAPREDTLADNASSHSGSSGGTLRPYSIGKQMNQVKHLFSSSIS